MHGVPETPMSEHTVVWKNNDTNKTFIICRRAANKSQIGMAVQQSFDLRMVGLGPL